jgi:deoxyxylulose-5-phosphate synthase
MPLNFKELEELFSRYRRVCFFEEVVYNGSTAQKLKAAFSNIEVKTLPNSFIEQGTVAELLRKYGLDAEGIAHVLRENKS